MRHVLIAAAAAIVALWALSRLLYADRIEPGLVNQRIQQAPAGALGVALSQRIPLRRVIIGSIQSRDPIEAASRIAARVRKVTIRAGDRVVRGQIIVTLDSSQLTAQVAQAQGDLAAAQAELNRTASDRKRFAALFARGSAAARENDAAEAAFRSAAARVAQTRAAVEAARAELVYATVRSPVNGVVVERLAEPGDMAMPGKPLASLYSEDALRVELEAPEDLARNVETGTPLDVKVDATGASYQTAVSEIVPAADPMSRSFIIRAPLPSGQHLRPGMFARATLTIGSEDVLTIPRAAVEQVGQLETVRVYDRGQIETRMVSLGRGFGDRLEVLAGLQPGDHVVIDRVEGAQQ